MLIEFDSGYKFIVDTHDIESLSAVIGALNLATFEPVYLECEEDIDVSILPVIIELLAQKQLTVVGVVHTSEEVSEFAKVSNLAIVSSACEPQAPKHLFITKPSIIRGDIKKNEQLYAKNTDLIVLGDVLDKAEAISDKNLYIYGGSYGKIFAGVKSNNSAKIFVNFFASKLVCINGVYRQFDVIPSEYYNKPVEITLVGDSLQFRVLV